MARTLRIAVCPGDGIGPEIMAEAEKVLCVIESEGQVKFQTKRALVGGAAHDACGEHLPAETIKVIEASDALLFGSVGGPVDSLNEPKWKDAEKNALLGLRKHFNLAVNIRPTSIHKPLAHLSPLKESIIKEAEVDFVIVRELVSGLYFGKRELGETSAYDTLAYTADEIRVPLRFAFETAQQTPSKTVCVVDKANVLDTSRLWRKVANEMSKEFSDVKVVFMYVDNAAMQLIQRPSQFSVLVTDNMFGDILSDAASVLPGSLGLMPSASLGDKVHLFEPSGGSAPDIAGQQVANPIGQILSVAMMLRYSFKMEREAVAIERAVRKALNDGARTKDLARQGETSLTTAQMGDAVCKALKAELVATK
eukprot:GHVN01084987.1.p1 GENE.GHVN01084987.1~~GHVN01084987.1.p1  ORF type:complete len:366 (+),score=76.66 GHVN01084987.1:113-1210(+)